MVAPMAKKKQDGLFPEPSNGGVQGLFEQSRQSRPLVGTATTTEPSAPELGHRAQAAPPAPTRRRKKGIRRYLWIVHVTVAIVALVGIANSGKKAANDIHIPSVPSFSSSSSTTKTSSGDTFASSTMKIVPSGGPVGNGVYHAAGSTITGAGSRTTFEFALTGRGNKQRLVYVAGLRVRDASCDGASRTSSAVSGLALYNDELVPGSGRVRGRTITGRFRGGEESFTGTARSATTITGTFRFGSYTRCPTGGHFTFLATRSASDTPILANALQRIGG